MGQTDFFDDLSVKNLGADLDRLSDNGGHMLCVFLIEEQREYMEWKTPLDVSADDISHLNSRYKIQRYCQEIKAT